MADRRRLFLMACAAFGAASAHGRAAEAFNASTHRRVVEVAVDSMNVSKPITPPAGVSVEQWLAFTNRLQASIGRLNLLHTGLSPAQHASAIPPIPEINNPELCEYHQKDLNTGRELNLLYANQTRIQEFKYYWEDGNVSCPPELREPASRIDARGQACDR